MVRGEFSYYLFDFSVNLKLFQNKMFIYLKRTEKKEEECTSLGRHGMTWEG